jgi:hypothetical protein
VAKALVPVAALVLAGLVVWGVSGVGRRASGVRALESRPAVARSAQPVARSPLVTITGHVLDQADREPVASAEVVVRGPLGVATARTSNDGAFSLEVAPGTYRIGVRGGGVLTVGMPERERLLVTPSPLLIAVPDDTLLPLVSATGDVTNLELVLPREATIAGYVTDRDAKYVAHAIVRARSLGPRPAYGSDLS